MNQFVLALLLGIVEGVTEFLPVSSTAHLRITESLLGLDLGDGYWKMFSIVIQLGAILCLPFYFRERIVKFLSTFPRGERGDRTALTHPLTLTMIAFVCTAGPGIPADEDHRQAPGEPAHHGTRADHWRRHHVGCRLALRALDASPCTPSITWKI